MVSKKHLSSISVDGDYVIFQGINEDTFAPVRFVYDLRCGCWFGPVSFEFLVDMKLVHGVDTIDELCELYLDKVKPGFIFNGSDYYSFLGELLIEFINLQL